MRISNVNPKYLKSGELEKLEGGQTVSFLGSRIRLVDADEIEAHEIETGRKFESSKNFIPVIWIKK